MTEILQGLFQLVIWVTIPAIATVVLFKLYAISHGTAPKEYLLSARAGFWGGITFFLIIFVAQVGRYVKSGFPHEAIYQGFNPFLAIGAAIGIFAVLQGKRLVRANLIGWLILGITTLTLWTLFHYLFIRSTNEYILSLALGTALGIFGYSAYPAIKRAAAQQ